LDLALDFTRRGLARAVLMLTHGLSGSGKTTLTQGLLESIGALRIRADVERKRPAGLQPLESVDSQRASALYGQDMTDAVYAQLGRLAAPVLDSGYHTILDATFLRRAQRDAARQLAVRQAVPCVVLDFDADIEVLRRRLHERSARGTDASDADETVLTTQMRKAEPLQNDEAGPVFRCRLVAPTAGAAMHADWTPLLKWLACGAFGKTLTSEQRGVLERAGTPKVLRTLPWTWRTTCRDEDDLAAPSSAVGPASASAQTRTSRCPSVQLMPIKSCDEPYGNHHRAGLHPQFIA
jgi:predicted kinase